MDEATIYRWIERWQVERNLADKPKGGRPPKLTYALPISATSNCFPLILCKIRIFSCSHDKKYYVYDKKLESKNYP
ncbi:MAG: hypothetical protein ACUVXA_02625 [Candidatus Jordarchaeum sp.]|uniref:hypothetical protein n=1 Tax=Candidatus Jordarchaeum sp. TaxID=2823881 RepID=UPI00404B2AD2